jgi:hypothetical protein
MTKYLLLSVLAVLTIASPARASLGPNADLPGLDPATWGRIHQRADLITKAIAKAYPNATPQDVACITAWLQFGLYRRVQVLDALTDAPTLFVHMSGEDGAHDMGNVNTGNKGNVPYKHLVTDEAEAPGNATDRLRNNVNDTCRGGNGGGGSGQNAVDPFRVVEKWKANNPNWDTDAAYGPQLFPEYLHRVRTLRGAVTAQGVAEKVAAKHPGLDLRAIGERLLKGQATGQDVEQLRVALELAGASIILNARGVLTTAPARVVPFWVVPPDRLKGSEPKPGEMY